MKSLQKQQSSATASTKRALTSSFDDGHEGDGEACNDLRPLMSNENTPLLKAVKDSGVAEEEEVDGDSTTASFESTSATSCCANLVGGGTVRVAIGAMLFAATNAAATALYRRKGSTVVSLYVLRSPIIYIINALLAATVLEVPPSDNDNNNIQRRRNDNNQAMIRVATNILLLRTGEGNSADAWKLALLRSFLNSIKAVLLSVGFVYLTYSDAFVIFKGIAVCGTIVVSRLVLGNSESLRWSELLCGVFVILGILMIDHIPSHDVKRSQSTDDVLSSASWMPRQTAGAAVVALSGLLSAFSGTLMRALSSNAGPHKLSPSMLLSYLMVVMFLVNGFVVMLVRPIILKFTNSENNIIDGDDAWDWTRWIWPNDITDWLLLLTNCCCTLGAHLATASGYQTTRAGIVAFLQLTEIPWVYLIDVSLLDESTTILKTEGSALVFASAVAVALLRTTRNNNR